MSVKINEQIVPLGGNRPGGVYAKTYITIHETGNFKPDATAKAHANWMSNGSNGETGYHYTVDENEAYHHIPDGEKAWHAGDGANGTGNLHSIGIEICVNQGADFEKAKKNAAWLAAKLAKDNNIPLDHIVQHNHWSGKDCPQTIRKTGKWNTFLSDCKAYYNETTGTGTVSGTIKAGTLVKLSANAVYYSGAKIPDWVKNQNWIVKSVSGDRAVIDQNEKKTNSINSPVNVKYLTTVSGSVSGSASTAVKKSIDEIAKEVIAGKWGNGTDRKNRLTAAGYDYETVQKRVNELLK